MHLIAKSLFLPVSSVNLSFGNIGTKVSKFGLNLADWVGFPLTASTETTPDGLFDSLFFFAVAWIKSPGLNPKDLISFAEIYASFKPYSQFSALKNP